MKIVITGASGQLGSYLLDELLPGHEVTGIDLAPTKFADHAPVIRSADIRDRAEMVRAMKGAEVVVHCAAQVSVEKSVQDPYFDLDVNIKGTVTLLDAASEAKVDKFIYISSAAVYGDPRFLPVTEEHPLNPKSPYGASKVGAEQYCRVFAETKKLPYVIVRPFNFYSPRADPQSPYSGVITKFVEWARQGKPLLIEGDGLQTRDFISVLDVSRMIVQLASSGVKEVVLNCGSGKATTINELARTVVKVSGARSEIRHVAPRVGDIRHSVSDIRRAEDLLSFAPQVSLEDGIRTFFA